MNLVEVHTTTVTRLYKSHPITPLWKQHYRQEWNHYKTIPPIFNSQRCFSMILHQQHQKLLNRRINRMPYSYIKLIIKVTKLFSVLVCDGFRKICNIHYYHNSLVISSSNPAQKWNVDSRYFWILFNKGKITDIFKSVIIFPSINVTSITLLTHSNIACF